MVLYGLEGENGFRKDRHETEKRKKKSGSVVTLLLHPEALSLLFLIP